MTNETSKFDSGILEELTAYLDGELETADQQLVEQRLSKDANYRNELQQLQRTWDALDTLPTPQPNQSFTQSTLKLVVDDAARTVRKRQTNLLAWPIRLLVLVGIPILAFFGAYKYLNYLRDAPNRSLLNNLHLIENLQMYQAAGSVEFLQAVAQADPDHTLLDNPEITSSLDMTYEQRKELVQSYDLRQLDRLGR